MNAAVPKISIMQTVVLFALAVGITNHVIITPMVLHASLRDSWISGLLAIPPLLLWSSVMYAVIRLTRQTSLFDWFKSRYNAPMAWAVVAPIAVYLLCILFMTVRDTTAWTQMTYLPRTPYPMTVCLFVLSAYLCALSGLRTIAIVAGLLLPAVVAFGLFVMTVNYQFKDYGYLFPVFTHGFAPVAHGILYALGGLTEFTMILALQHHIGGKIKFRTFIWLTLLVTGLMFGPMIASIAIFGPFEANDQRFPAYEQWRMVLIGRFIAHLDFLSIYQWLAGSQVRIALALYLLFDLCKIRRRKRRAIWMFAFCAALIAACSITRFTDTMFYFVLQNYYFPIANTVFYVFPFVLLPLILTRRGAQSRETG